MSIMGVFDMIFLCLTAFLIYKVYKLIGLSDKAQLLSIVCIYLSLLCMPFLIMYNHLYSSLCAHYMLYFEHQLSRRDGVFRGH